MNVDWSVWPKVVQFQTGPEKNDSKTWTGQAGLQLGTYAPG